VCDTPLVGGGAGGGKGGGGGGGGGSPGKRFLLQKKGMG